MTRPALCAPWPCWLVHTRGPRRWPEHAPLAPVHGIPVRLGPCAWELGEPCCACHAVPACDGNGQRVACARHRPPTTRHPIGRLLHGGAARARLSGTVTQRHPRHARHHVLGCWFGRLGQLEGSCCHTTVQPPPGASAVSTPVAVRTRDPPHALRAAVCYACLQSPSTVS